MFHFITTNDLLFFFFCFSMNSIWSTALCQHLRMLLPSCRPSVLKNWCWLSRTQLQARQLSWRHQRADTQLSQVYRYESICGFFCLKFWCLFIDSDWHWYTTLKLWNFFFYFKGWVCRTNIYYHKKYKSPVLLIDMINVIILPGL